MGWQQCEPRSIEGQQKGHEPAEADVHYAVMITVATAPWNQKLHLHENGCHEQFGIKSERKPRPINMFKIQSPNMMIVCIMMTILLCSFTEKLHKNPCPSAQGCHTAWVWGTVDAHSLIPDFSKRLFLQNKQVTQATTEKNAAGSQQYRGK